MPVIPISGELNTSTQKPLYPVVPAEQPVKKASSAIDEPASQAVQASIADTTSSNKISSAKKQSSDAGGEGQQSSRSMNHVLAEYDQQGKARTKFIDSNNDVVYQIPTEMVARLEDRMSNTEISARVKG